jgi:multiple sugar transport system permease protein
VPTIRRIAWYALLSGLGLLFVAPLAWMLTTSFKTHQDAERIPPRWIPQPFSTHGYDALLDASAQTPVVRWFLNSMLAASLHTVLVLVTASMAAYALARLQFRGRRAIFAVVVATLFIPPFAMIIPNYLIVDALGWLDTLLVIVVPSAASAFGVFFLHQFFLSLPREIEEAALLDGATQLQVFTRVVLPLSKPPLATLAVLAFLTNWNDFLWPIYVLFSADQLTLPPGLGALQGAYVTDYPVIMAGAALASIPALLLFVIAQRYIIEGISRTGLKG